MSIYNKTWNPDEEITSDSLNRMSSDINNQNDNIHAQYAPIKVCESSTDKSVIYYVNFYAVNPGGTIVRQMLSGGGGYLDKEFIFTTSNSEDGAYRIQPINITKIAGKNTLTLYFTAKKAQSGGLSYSLWLNWVLFNLSGAVGKSGSFEITDAGYTNYSVTIDISGMTDWTNLRLCMGLATTGVANDTNTSVNAVTNIRAEQS